MTPYRLEEITTIERPERNGCGITFFPITLTDFTLSYTIDYIDREAEDKGEFGKLTFYNCVKLFFDRESWHSKYKEYGQFLAEGEFYRLHNFNWQTGLPQTNEIKIVAEHIIDTTTNLQHFIFTDRDGCWEIICSSFSFEKVPWVDYYGHPALVNNQIKTHVHVNYYNCKAQYLVIADKIDNNKFKVVWIHCYNPAIGQWDFHLGDIINKGKIINYPQTVGLGHGLYTLDNRKKTLWWKFW